MIEIVKFYRQVTSVEIGFKQGGAVVYASVPNDLNDSDAKQKAYELSKSALDYEQGLDTPSFVVENETTEDGDIIEFEKFIPENSKVKEINIIGDTFVSFEDNSNTKEIKLIVSAIDQYGDIIEPLCEWFGAEDGVLKVENKDETYEVSVTCGDIRSSFTVTVQGYPVIAPSAPEYDYEKLTLYEAIAGLEERMELLEGGEK